MAKPMIEQNERSITISKALAWTMLVSVTGLIWWVAGHWPHCRALPTASLPP